MDEVVLHDLKSHNFTAWFKQNISTSSLQHKNSYFPHTILHWNSLNKDTAESSSLDIFKNRLPWYAVCVPAHRREIPAS